MTDLTLLAEMIKPVVFRVWDGIGPDAIEAIQYGAGEVTNRDCVEMCLDASRLRTNGGEDGPAADDLVSEAHGEHGWDAVIEALSNSINLY